MLIDLSPGEVALLGEALIGRSEFYTKASDTCAKSGTMPTAVLAFADKSEAFTKLHVRLLAARSNTRGSSPVVGELIRSSRIVCKVFEREKQFCTSPFHDELKCVYPGWKHRVER